MTILVTGGAGYIGSHTVVQLIESGHDVVVLDNLSNGSRVALERIESITGRTVPLIVGDVRDRQAMDRLLNEHHIAAVIHFAGLKAVGESVDRPLTYYDTNVHGTLALCDAMQAAGVRRLIFSSSATVYGSDAPVPYVESLPHGTTTSPYGTSKAMVERMLDDLVRADERWSVVMLRYFNPIGAHPSGLIGEDPQGIPNNLMPFIAQVAVGRLPELAIFGNDYPTADGTCVRDYLHVMDLADGHVQALAMLEQRGAHVYNLGTGRGVSVMEMLRSFERVSGRRVPFRIAGRRSGDLAAFWADADKARREFGWQAKRELDEMMADTWRWQSDNPHGFCV